MVPASSATPRFSLAVVRQTRELPAGSAGRSRVAVYRKPRVAIISTGDEVVPVDAIPKPGQIRDINRYTLGAFCRRVGAGQDGSGCQPVVQATLTPNAVDVNMADKGHLFELFDKAKVQSAPPAVTKVEF